MIQTVVVVGPVGERLIAVGNAARCLGDQTSGFFAIQWIPRAFDAGDVTEIQVLQRVQSPIERRRPARPRSPPRQVLDVNGESGGQGQH